LTAQKNQHQILREINKLLMELRQEYPELYRNLDEIPITIPTLENPEIDLKTYSEFLESLQHLILHFKKK